MVPFKNFHRNSIALIAVLVPFSVFVFWDYGAISAVVITSFLLVFPTIILAFTNRNAESILEKTGEESGVLGFCQDRFNLSGSLRRNGKIGPLFEQQLEKGINLCGSLRRNDKPEPLIEQQLEKGINLCESLRRNDKSEILLEEKREKGINLCENLRRNNTPEPLFEQDINLCESLRHNDKPEILLEQKREEGINLCESLRRNDKPEILLEQKREKGIITEELEDCWPNVGDIVADQKNGNGIDQIQEQMVNSPELLYSESESNDLPFSSEDSDVDWLFAGQSPDCSDESISDEESLIEIAIPTLNYVDDSKLFFQYKSQDHFLALKQHGLMDNEMNEEDNLIEIDISIGSIKCSRFEIEA